MRNNGYILCEYTKITAQKTEQNTPKQKVQTLSAQLKNKCSSMIFDEFLTGYEGQRMDEI